MVSLWLSRSHYCYFLCVDFLNWCFVGRVGLEIQVSRCFVVDRQSLEFSNLIDIDLLSFNFDRFLLFFIIYVLLLSGSVNVVIFIYAV